MCKDSSALSASGYNSASQCSNAVLQGSYESIMEGAAKGGIYALLLIVVLFRFLNQTFIFQYFHVLWN
jgi:hypothetical protein